jgi:hypothetical protein
MKFARNKNVSTLIVYLLMLSMFASLALTTVEAQTVRTTPTNIYVTAQPIAGVGQSMFLIYWTEQIPPDIGEQTGAVASPNGRAGWYGVKMTVTTPNGTQIVFDMPYSDPVGGGYMTYVPTEIGNYSLKANFPETWKNTTSTKILYPAAESPVDPFIVRQEPIATWPEAPLPENYWERPISGPSHSWQVLAGQWLGTYANQYPFGGSGGTTRNYAYGEAPESPHILWTRQHYPTGGIMDTRFVDQVYTLNHYQDITFNPSIILDGVIHYIPQYTGHWGEGNALTNFGWGGLSLYTGEQLFVDPLAIKPAFGQIYLYNSPNQHGGFSYLYRIEGVTLPNNVTRTPYPPGSANETVTLTTRSGTQTWEMIDAWTRNRVAYIANVSATGTQVYGKDGSILYYNTVNKGTTASPKYYLTVWNSSAMESMLAGDYGTYYWQWRPQWGGHADYGFRWRENVNAFHDGDQAFSLNVSIPSLLGPRNAMSNQTATIRAVRDGEYVIFGTQGLNNPNGIVPCWLFALSLEPGKEGQKLWETSFTPPFADVEAAQFTAGIGMTDVVPENEVVLFDDERTLTRWGYDMKTGQLLWTSEPEPQLHYYGFSQTIYDGKLISYSRAGGVLLAYDLRSGEIVWKYIAPGEGTESPYGNAVTSSVMVADGKLYVGSSEHSASTPLWRTPGLRCVNATDGTEIWKTLNWGTEMAVADGILVAFNWYDGQVYAFGKGPSATTVTASPKATVLGNTVVVDGTVTDQTPGGRRNINNELQFALKGTPAISDEDMQAWMEYNFKGQAFPANAKGVEVTVSVLDPNNNLYEVGKTTSDINGYYAVSFVPEVPGNYKITANFAGSKSYYPSTSTTTLTIGEAASTTQPTAQPVQSIADAYFVPAIVGLFATIIIVSVIMMLLILRRRS